LGRGGRGGHKRWGPSVPEMNFKGWTKKLFHWKGGRSFGPKIATAPTQGGGEEKKNPGGFFATGRKERGVGGKGLERKKKWGEPPNQTKKKLGVNWGKSTVGLGGGGKVHPS